MEKTDKIKLTNEVGAEEVDNFVIPTLTPWQKFKRALFGKRTFSFVWGLIRTVLLIGICYLIIYPLMITLITSFMPLDDVYDPTVILVPTAININTYVAMWSYGHIPQLYFSSFSTSLMFALMQMCSCMLVAYGLARFKFKGNNFIFLMCIFTLMIPIQMLTTSMYFRYKAFNPMFMFAFGEQLSTVPNIDLTRGWTAIGLLSSTATMYRNGLFVFLLRQYFVNQPKELEEAAYIDGAGPFRTFIQVMLPSALPMLVTVFLFAFVWQYNDRYYIGMLNPNAEVMATRVTGMGANYVKSVLDVSGDAVLNSLYQSACTIMHIAPIVVLYCFCQKFFVQSIERSGMVG
ncbi:MAG: carbohydrate ABC transporter permease [Clostridiales bacterium]|nr:carbohydrate ABC transporter permease [Clostridiales bacterium]